MGSKASENRAGLQAGVNGALAVVNALLDPVQPLEPTVGDEFQGAFRDVATATRASLLLRLELLQEADVDSRYGLGLGEVSLLESGSQIQDGPGWWSARAAIDRSKELSVSPRTAFARTGFACWTPPSPGGADTRLDGMALNAFLLCRDAIVTPMTPRSRRNLRGLLVNRPQSVLAEEEQVTQSAISQNLARSGAFAVEAAQRCLEEQLR